MKVILLLFLLLPLLFASNLQKDIETGVDYYKSKQFERALEIFDRLLIEHPKNKRVRLEYARVLYALKMYDESKKEFIKVLNTNPPLVVQKNIKYFIKQINKRQKTNFFSGSVSIGASSDSNIENKSDNPMYAGFIDSNRDKRRDNFITEELSLNHTKKLKNAFWQNSLYLYDEQSHAKSSDKVSFLNLQTAYKVPLFGLRATFPLSYSLTYIDNQRYSKSLRFQPKIELLKRNSILSLRLSYEKNKNYNNDERSYNSYGVKTKYLWMLNKFRNFVGLEIKKYKKVKGERLDVSKNRLAMDVSSSYPLMQTNLLNLFYKKTYDKYTKKDPTIQDNRKDKTDNLSFSFNQEIRKGSSFELGFTKIKNDSNLEFYSYDKSIFSIKLRKNF